MRPPTKNSQIKSDKLNKKEIAWIYSPHTTTRPAQSILEYPPHLGCFFPCLVVTMRELWKFREYKVIYSDFSGEGTDAASAGPSARNLASCGSSASDTFCSTDPPMIDRRLLRYIRQFRMTCSLYLGVSMENICRIARYLSTLIN